jgi:hypothetical protein
MAMLLGGIACDHGPEALREPNNVRDRKTTCGNIGEMYSTELAVYR